MSDDQPCEVPFIEQLRDIPKDFRVTREIQWAENGTPTGHQFIPVGFMFHRAADEIERLAKASPEVQAPSKDAQEASRVVKRGLHVHFEGQNIMADEILRLASLLPQRVPAKRGKGEQMTSEQLGDAIAKAMLIVQAAKKSNPGWPSIPAELATIPVTVDLAMALLEVAGKK